MCRLGITLDDIPMPLEPRLNLFGSVYRRIIILEYDSACQQYVGHCKNFIIEDVEIFIRSNPAIDGKRSPTEYHEIAARVTAKPPQSSTVGSKPSRS